MIIDQARTETFAYDSALRDWDRMASVRLKQRRVLVDEESEGKFYFPPELAPESQHSKIQSLGDLAIREILIQRLHAYLESMTQIEQDVVNRVTLEIAQQKIGACLPWDITFDAFKIYTDESYHSLLSFSIGHEIEVATGVKPYPVKQYQCLARLEALVEQVPWDLQQLADVFSVIVCEMLVPRTLTTLLYDARIVGTVREVVADHMADEEKHSVYFAQLLEFLWPLLSERERQEIGPLLPRFILAFLEPDYPAIERSLADRGLTPAEVQQVIDESYPHAQVIASVRSKARTTIQHFERIGLFEEQSIVEAFQMSGLIF